MLFEAVGVRMYSPLMDYRSIAMTLFFIIHCVTLTSAKDAVGICYMQEVNQPAPRDVIKLYKRCGIERIRLYDPKPDVLQALRGSKLQVSLGIPNQDIPNLVGSQEAANSWVSTYVTPYNDVDFIYVTVGNKVIPSNLAQSIAPTIVNIHNALVEAGLSGIKVSTVVSSAVMGVSSPPSQGAFSGDAVADMTTVVSVLANIGSPLMVNVYPQSEYTQDRVNIPIGYALMSTKTTPVEDGSLMYYSLYEAMIDAFYSAMEKVGVANVGIVVMETGWPSTGNNNYTSTELARAYNTNLLNHITHGEGTPKRPNGRVDAFLFAMFNRNYGLFYPNMQPVYPLFSC